MLRFVFDLDIPLLNGRVPFQRTAYELVRRCSGAEIPEGILKDQVGAVSSACWLQCCLCIPREAAGWFYCTLMSGIGWGNQTIE